jgi:hypothetical protein
MSLKLQIQAVTVTWYDSVSLLLIENTLICVVRLLKLKVWFGGVTLIFEDVTLKV